MICGFGLERMPIMETMARKKPRLRRSFTPEFKSDIVERCRAGDRTLGQVAKDFDLTETACGSGSSRPNATRAAALTGV